MSSNLTPNEPMTQPDGGEHAASPDEPSIAHDGRYYQYDGYRYERLADAVAYAEIVCSRQSPRTSSPLSTPFATMAPLSSRERELMFALSITYQDGAFVFQGYRYDRLIDAANYARHSQQLSATAL